MNKYIKLMKELANELISNNLADPEKIKGCTKEEIEKVENYYGVLLPESYKAFLTVMGHYCGDFYRGTDILYNEVFKFSEDEDISKYTIEYMLELGVQPPKEKLFSFSMHEGYQFEFFFINTSDDPLVYFFMGEENAKIKGGKSLFTEYITSMVENSIKSYKIVKKIIKT